MRTLRHSPLPARLLTSRLGFPALRPASHGALAAPAASPHSTWPAEVDLSGLPPHAAEPDVLLLDATFLACAVRRSLAATAPGADTGVGQVAPGASPDSSISQRLAFLVTRLQTEVRLLHHIHTRCLTSVSPRSCDRGSPSQPLTAARESRPHPAPWMLAASVPCRWLRAATPCHWPQRWRRCHLRRLTAAPPPASPARGAKGTTCWRRWPTLWRPARCGR